SQFTHMFMCGRILSVISLYYLRDKSPVWRDAGQKMVDGIKRLMIDKGDYCYVPVGVFEPNATLPADAPMPLSFVGEECVGRLIHGLSHFYKVTGYEPARELAGKVVCYQKDKSKFFGADGSFTNAGEKNNGATHFHAHSIVLLGMIEYALATND